MSKKFICLTAVGLMLAIAAGAGAQVGKGYILFEYWDNIGGGTAITDLTNNALYPNKPTSSEWRTVFESPVNRADNFGMRAQALLTPPADGDYTFYIATDDAGELWLSTDDKPANAKKIAFVAGWAGADDWQNANEKNNQKSAPITLKGAQNYYIMGLEKEGGGGDNLDVGWTGPVIGNTITAIAGKYCTAIIRDPEPLFPGLMKAKNPDPAVGKTDVTNPLVSWTAGVTAVSHEVYFGTNPTPGPAEFMGPWPMAMYFHVMGLTPGDKVYWRVDEVDAAGVKTVGDIWNFTVMPMTAHVPSPADGATDILLSGQVAWTAGQGAATHVVYFGADKALVTAGDASVKVASGAAMVYKYTGLLPFVTYYWRVDEVDPAGVVSAGPVWSFNTVTYMLLTTAAVNLNYSNNAPPYASQVELATDPNWLQYGLTDLLVKFTGRAGPSATTGVVYDNGTYKVTGAGTDIWGTSDQFQYVYKTLTGDSTIIARVVSNGTGANGWAKGGVMVRQSLAGNSASAYVGVTGSSANGNGACFQNRATAGLDMGANDATSNATPAAPINPPYWVKLERKGNDFSGSISPDGQTWTKLGATRTVVMADPVYVGLFVTSHVDAATNRTYTIDSVNTTGAAIPAGRFVANDDVGMPTNDPQPLFAAVQDLNGNFAVATFNDPAATQKTSAWTWKIPLSSLVGVDLTKVAKLYLGAGNLLSPVCGGSGVVTFNDIRVVKPVVIAPGTDVTQPGDNVIGVPTNGNWPAAEYPALVIDNKTSTKFLHFNGKTDPVGFQVEPLAGPSIVTGMTFSTANDSDNRDPIIYQLSGSNVSINGPWTLIAAGDIVDFENATAWPRLTKGTTPIKFHNSVAYKYYQVMFPLVRNPATANSMQISEVELLGSLAQ
ncbi:MAG: PA14 domain-containing protein [Phycisphaerae bacterium]|nr:PA14 domain-containing protein [Phycisphaerae bacterium]